MTGVQTCALPISFRTRYYQALRQHLTERRAPQTLFFYAKDEPKPADFATVKAQSKRVRAAGIPVLVTHQMTPELGPATDIFCPVLNCFFQRPGLPTCKNVMSADQIRARHPRAHVWWYQSCMSQGCTGGASPKPEIERVFRDWASYMVDFPVPLNRAMGPLAYLAGVEGELYFDTVAAYASHDPWNDVFLFGGNGDGTLFYPGTRDVLGGPEDIPVTSLRLKAIRDGLEDFEYLHVLETLGGRTEAQSLVRQWVRSGYDITLDPAAWEGTRNALISAVRKRSAAPRVP